MASDDVWIVGTHGHRAGLVVRFLSLARLASRLGPWNVARVLVYRSALRTRVYEWLLPVTPPVVEPISDAEPTSADPELAGGVPSVRYFSAHDVPVDVRPDWFRNPWRETRARRDARHWSCISDFDDEIGDIKTVWEASRFDWAPKLAWQAREQKGATKERAMLEAWVRDWCAENPPNAGVNWKCAQEVSLRALNLWLSLLVSEGLATRFSAGALRFFEVHVRRVLPTTYYAKAQDNNHATSEAAALFCLGACLAAHGDAATARLGVRAGRAGRRLLENRIGRLVLPDGSFSQASTTYHRLMLDTLVLCELCRRLHSLPPFSDRLRERLRAATRWLFAFVDPVSGDAPNLGANDGACLFNLDEAAYRDFRPILRRAFALFEDRHFDGAGSDPLLRVFGIVPARPAPSAIGSVSFPCGGYGRLDAFGGRGFLTFRYPRFPFRPAHCDAHHLDLWLDGLNCSLDGGTYSYNPDRRELAGLLSGTAAHCTIMFDGREQMPKVSRFLYGEWLEPELMELDTRREEIRSAYVDFRGARHERRVVAGNRPDVLVEDRGSGFEQVAELRWRLPALDWTLEGGRLVSALFSLSFEADEPYSTSLEDGLTSLRYMECSPVVVLRLTFRRPFVVRTRFHAPGGPRA